MGDFPRLQVRTPVADWRWVMGLGMVESMVHGWASGAGEINQKP